MMRTMLIILCLTAANLHAGNDDIQSYTVIAPSGLSLRAGPGAECERLLVIPFNQIVDIKINEIDSDLQDTIGGKIGVWFPTDYKGKRGYLFSPYLKYGNLYKTADTESNINHDYRIVIPGIRMDALNYDPNLHWYALCKSSYNEQSPLSLTKVDLQLDLEPLDWEEMQEYDARDGAVSLDADVGEDYLVLLIGTKEEIQPGEMTTYYNDIYGEFNWGRPIYPYEQLMFWEASATERYFLEGAQELNHPRAQEEMDPMKYELGIKMNSGPSRYEQAFDQVISTELAEYWEEAEGIDTYVPTDFHYHPRLFWQGDLNQDGAPDLLFYTPNTSECCGGSEEYYLLISQKNGDRWEWKRAADDIMHSWGGC